MRDYLAGHWTLVLLWALVLSAVDVCLMGVDKRRARRDAWRVPEKTLWLFALLGGAPGGWLGMRAFHHKTRHWYFTAINTAAILAWAALLAYRNGVFS